MEIKYYKITEEEVSDLESLIEYSWEHEQDDCETVIYEQAELEQLDGNYNIKLTGTDADRQYEKLAEHHVYWKLLTLQELLNRIK